MDANLQDRFLDAQDVSPVRRATAVLVTAIRTGLVTATNADNRSEVKSFRQEMKDEDFSEADIQAIVTDLTSEKSSLRGIPAINPDLKVSRKK